MVGTGVMTNERTDAVERMRRRRRRRREGFIWRRRQFSVASGQLIL